MSTDPTEKKTSWLLRLYCQAIENSPLLKHSRVIVVTAIVLAIIALFKLASEKVFLFVFIVIAICIIAFSASLLMSSRKPFFLFLRAILTLAIVLTCIGFIVGFGIFIFTDYPHFFKRWFPDEHSKTIGSVPRPVHDTIKVTPAVPSQKKIDNPNFRHKILSIQLGPETDGFATVYIRNKRVLPLAESTKFNPRIEVSGYSSQDEILIVTNKGDSCWVDIPYSIDSTTFRIPANCK